MSLVRRAARRDISEPEVIAAFKAAGAKVRPLSIENVPDLLVGFLGSNHLVEVKYENAPLTPGQKEWHESWTGERPAVARNQAQAKKLVRMWLQAFADQQAKEGR